jgi:soluble lytic murein transglycosylase
MTRKALNWTIGIVCGLAILTVAFFTLPRIIADSMYPVEYTDLIQKYCVEPYDLDPALVLSVMKKESGFNPNAVSPAGATGLMQVMRATGASAALQLGMPEHNLLNPEHSVKIGCYVLAGMKGRCAKYNLSEDMEIKCALAGYNGGGAAADRFARSGSTASLARETSNYLDVITGLYQPAYESRVKESVDFVQADKPTTLWGKIIYGLVGQFLIR